MRQIGLLVFCGLLFLVRLHLLYVEAHDPDEFEHLHAGLSVARGDVPYRDFFEHHGPLPYALGAVIAVLVGPTTSLLIANRLVSYFFVIATAWLTYRLALQVAGKRSAWWSLVWLLTLPWFIDRSLEWRPDVPAMFLIVGSAWFAARQQPFATGLSLAMASLCTQKCLFLIVGIGIGMLIQSRHRLRTIMLSALGFAAPWMIAFAVFALLGGVRAFVNCLFVYPAIWPMRISVGWELLQILIFYAPLSLLLGIAAWGSALISVAKRDHRSQSWSVIAWPVLLHWLAWPIVPAAYLQFHLLGLPLLAIAVARFIRILSLRFLRAHRPQHRRRLVSLPMTALLLPTFAWMFLHHVILPRQGIVTRTDQLATLAQTRSAVPLDAKVQDGFTGMACFHRHFDYWWWLNEHSIALAEKLGELPAIEKRLLENPPAALLLDSGLRKAIARIADVLGNHYEQVFVDEKQRWMLYRKK